jgi:outer membrane protein TolC
MRDRHQPSEEFVHGLEQTIRREVERRNEAAGTIRWMPQPRLRLALGAVALVIVSMAAGGAVVAAAYEAQENQRRDLLSSNYEQRIELAELRVTTARDILRDLERRRTIGLATEESILEAQAKVVVAEADLTARQLDLAEVRQTGREPLNEISAPLVSGRDFVSERWQVELRVPEAQLALEKARLQGLRRRVDVGVANPDELRTLETNVMSLEAAIHGLRRKLDARQEFVRGRIDRPRAELRLLEIEAEQRRSVILPQLELARQNLQRIARLVQVGLAANIELREAELRLKEMETELAKADLDLALVRKQLTGK